MNPLEGLINNRQLADFCERWKIVELIAYDPIRYANTPEDEIQLMIVWKPDADWSLLDHVGMEYDLSDLTGKPVSLVSKRHVELSDSWDDIRERVYKSAQAIYVAG